MLKLALGTVQFGLAYGINNYSGIPNDAELASIFSLAKQSGIDVLDTAQGYGNSEERIGGFSDDKFNIISKFKILASPYPFHIELKESLKKLRTDYLFGYLAHDADLLIQNPSWWLGLQEAKNLGLVKKIGYSLYSINQLDSLIAKQMIPDLIQFPYNILDRRFEPYMSELTSLGVEIHTRSVYLQGLLQMDPILLPRQMILLQPILKQVKEIAIKHQVSIGKLCLGFAIINPSINKVVIGVDNAVQLAENIDFSQNVNLSNEIVSELLSIEVNDKNLLNPSNWK